jgi:hypothetical protein
MGATAGVSRRGVSIRTDDAVGEANWVARRQRATKGGRVGREGDVGGGSPATGENGKAEANEKEGGKAKERRG